MLAKIRYALKILLNSWHPMVKYLSVILEQKLTFKKHQIEKVKTKFVKI